MFVKICGVTGVDDAAWAIQQGASALGLNFHPQSPRYLPYAQAQEMLCALPKKVATVGVFVRPQPAALQLVLEGLGLDLVQLYEADLSLLRDLLPLLKEKVILAQGVRQREDCQHLSHQITIWKQAGVPPVAILVDAKVEGLHGGTGQTAPWELIRSWPWEVPLILAGGLHPENVSAAIAAVQPWGVDVASGVEIAPGVKDREKVRRFIAAVRG
jgi:phosphoribosylanthranilate isomerase